MNISDYFVMFYVIQSMCMFHVCYIALVHVFNLWVTFIFSSGDAFLMVWCIFYFLNLWRIIFSIIWRIVFASFGRIILNSHSINRVGKDWSRKEK